MSDAYLAESVIDSLVALGFRIAGDMPGDRIYMTSGPVDPSEFDVSIESTQTGDDDPLMAYAEWLRTTPLHVQFTQGGVRENYIFVRRRG